jgi:hypothetical protein
MRAQVGISTPSAPCTPTNPASRTASQGGPKKEFLAIMAVDRIVFSPGAEKAVTIHDKFIASKLAKGYRISAEPGR